MIETIHFLSAPLAICLILVGVLSYLGNHILSRGIIFIDIAVAQIAALGTMIGILCGLPDGSFFVSLFSLVFTLGILTLFALSKFEFREISQEVIIGIIYGISLAMAMLLVDITPGGSNFIQETLTGRILWVTWHDVTVTFVLFFFIALIHIFLIKKFVLISEGQLENFSKKQIRLYDLLFYVSFGFVVVKAVEIGGIFLVFMYLIAPASIATLLSSNWRNRILIGWFVGFLASVIGIYISYDFNFPNGPTIVCVLGLFLVSAILFQKIFAESKLKLGRS